MDDAIFAYNGQVGDVKKRIVRYSSTIVQQGAAWIWQRDEYSDSPTHQGQRLIGDGIWYRQLLCSAALSPDHYQQQAIVAYVTYAVARSLLLWRHCSMLYVLPALWMTLSLHTMAK